MKVCSFFTPNGAYPALAKRLRESCDRVGLANAILPIAAQQTWHRAINLKPGFILQQLLDAREPVLWLDCDCELRKYPAILDKQWLETESEKLLEKMEGFGFSGNTSLQAEIDRTEENIERLEIPIDFAVLNWYADEHGLQRVKDYDGRQILNSGGVSYWAYTAPSIELLVRWGIMAQANPDAVDDQTLDEVWKQHRPPVKPLWLPREYNWMDAKFGPATDDVVIWHEYVEGRHREVA